MKELIQYWQNKIPYNFKETVAKIKDSNCPLDFKVVDFDRVKDSFLEHVGIDKDDRLRSVDAIALDKKRDLCLIEMKGFGKDVNKLEFTKEKILEMIPKVADSLQILISILGYFGVSKKWCKVILHPKEFKIYPYLVIDYDFKDLHPIKLALQKELNVKISARVQTPIQLINCEEFNRLFNK